ncbi:MAG: glycosyltransferase family 2 protein [Erysipelotrichaceae bacterium]|nr:glycosyltransferase family 2 protein [Erysipelotrichaceae bacterium]
MNNEKIAVLIPCYNEELTIEKVVSDFKVQLPLADIYVYDNNSTDKTAELALGKGATVVKEPNQGKGNVVRSMFRDVDADIYIMVDGDDTYPADEVHKLIEEVRKGNDMVIGDRLSSTYYTENKRPFHNLGNDLVRWLINTIFRSDIRDVMTGYRAFSKKFVKTISVMSPGFQIETELTITALEYRYNVSTVTIQYKDRPEGSSSKLNTFSDGFKVLFTLFDMVKDYKPLLFFTLVSLIAFILGIIIFRLIFNVSGDVLFGPLVIVSLLLLVLGLILDHQKNIDKKNHELMVNFWCNKNNNY